MSFCPQTDQQNSQQPLWWNGYQSREDKYNPSAYAGGTESASMDDPDWQLRRGWQVGGSTASGVAASLSDRVLLSGLDSAMPSPILHYRDAFWSMGDGTLNYESNALHSLSMEYEDVENRTDR
jgi:hypothetical protein